jgi:hypothetical protein
VIKNMIRRMSLTAPKTSPSLPESPTNAKVQDVTCPELGSPGSHTEALAIRNRRFAFDGEMKDDTRRIDLHKIAEEATTPSDFIAAKLLSVNNTSSITKRRGYRPLSVRIGEAFNPFSSRDEKHEDDELVSNAADSIEVNPRSLPKDTDLSDKVKWSENLDPHIFNANFIAALTSKREYTYNTY